MAEFNVFLSLKNKEVTIIFSSIQFSCIAFANGIFVLDKRWLEKISCSISRSQTTIAITTNFYWNKKDILPSRLVKRSQDNFSHMGQLKISIIISEYRTHIPAQSSKVMSKQSLVECCFNIVLMT